MIFLLLRLCPWFVGGFAALVSWWQWRVPALYPWPLVAALVLYFLAVVALVWRSRFWKQGIAGLLPTLLVLVALGLGHLLIETTEMRLLTTVLFAFLPWVSLELGWFMLYDSVHVPVHGLARFNVALIPVGVWYLAFTLHGLHVLLQPVPWILAAISLMFSVLWFVGTMDSWREHRERRWMWASVLIGVHVAILLLLLPTSMLVHGSLAATLIALPLRLRQLARQPRLSPFLICLEGCALGGVWMAVLFSARWV